MEKSILESLEEVKNLLQDIENKVIEQNPTRIVFIYAIECKDKNILDSYVGSTFSMSNRRYIHYHNSKTSTSKLYSFVKENGGWSNFEFIILEKIEVSTNKEKMEKEQEWIKKKNPVLNSRRAFRTHKELQEQWNKATHKYRSKKLNI